MPDWFPWANAGADIAVADVDGDGRLDLVVLMVDAPAGANAGYYRSGPLGADGVVTGVAAVGGRARLAVLGEPGGGRRGRRPGRRRHAGAVVLAVDNPAGQNGGYYSVGWRLDAGPPRRRLGTVATDARLAVLGEPGRRARDRAARCRRACRTSCRSRSTTLPARTAAGTASSTP